MRKFYLFLIVLAFLLPKGTYAQYAPVDWQRIYSGVATPVIEFFPMYIYGNNKLVKTNDGKLVFAASTKLTGEISMAVNDISLNKLDGQGNVLWTKIIGGSGKDEVNAIKQATDGGFIVAGRTGSADGLFTGNHGGGSDAFVAKIDSVGNVLWVKMVGGSGLDEFNNIELLSDGYIAVGKTGSDNGDIAVLNGETDVLMTRFNLDGSVVWTKTFGGTGCENAYSLLVNKNEDIIIGGMYNASGPCGFNFSATRKLLLAINKAGVQLWRNEDINTPSSELGLIGNLTFNADSSQFCSIVKKDYIFKPYIYKFNSTTGVMTFTKQLDINSNYDLGATLIHRTPDNHYLVPLASPMQRTGLDTTRTYLAEIDDNGNVLSVNLFDFGDETIVGVQDRGNERLLLSNNRFQVGLQTRLSSFVPGNNTVINSFYPLNGLKYSLITIKGRSFTGATAVNFGGVPAFTFSVVNDSVITAIVNTGATGQVSVSAPGGTAVKDGFTFIVIPDAPTITSFAPTTAGYLHTVVIKGTYFSGVREVIFGGYPAYSFEVINDSTISAKVGRGGADDKVSVGTNKGNASLGGFTYLPPLPVSGFTPAYGPVGTTVRITGSQFSDTLAKNHVYFGQAEATILEASSSSLLVTVPPGAVSARIIITVDGKSGFTPDVFMVIQPGEDAVRSFSFEAGPALAASNAAMRSLTSGDFDGDGIADLAVVGKGSTILSVFKSTSKLDSITFGTGLTFSLPGNGMDVITGDVDMDGKMDILVKTNQESFISIFRNTSAGGNISFAPRVDIQGSSYPNNEDHNNLLALCDINGDGRPEIMTDNPGDRTFSILKNTGASGSIQFAPKIDFDYYPFSFVVRDFNGDGKPDIAMLSNGNFFVVFKNTSQGGNISLVKSPGMNLPFGRIIGITANDFDGDGKQDLAAIVTERNLTIFRNTSVSDSITFTPKSDWELAYLPNYINSGDIDSDGKTDIVIGNSSSTTFSVFRNLSSPGDLALAFKQDFATGSNAAQSVVTDINNDGKPDIATIAYEDSRVFIARNRLHEPIVQSFNPANAAKGDTITFKGENFTGVTAVRFGGIAARSVDIINDSTIRAVVDTGATGPVSVTNTYGRGSKAGFTFGEAPSITQFLPTKASKGSIVTIHGKNLKNITNITFGGTKAASFTVINDLIINARVDSGSTGDVTVTTLFGTDTLAGFTYGPAPVISSFAPVHGLTGDTITINGKYFTGGRLIRFGNIQATSFVVLNDTTIKAVVGKGASGSVMVFNEFGGAQVDGFLFDQTPLITSFSPLVGPVGSTVIIKGRNFSNTLNGNTVYFGAAKAAITEAADTVLSVIVPAGATYKPITVTNGDSLMAFSGSRFIVTFPGATDTLITQAAFAGRAAFAAGVGINDLKQGDLDNDGKTDLVAVLSNSKVVRVFRNTSANGALSFTTTDYPVNNPRAVNIEDINADGKLDILVNQDLGNTIYALVNTSTGAALSFKGTIALGGGDNIAAFRDLDLDGRPDIVIRPVSGFNVSIFRNVSYGVTLSFTQLIAPITGSLTSKTIVIEDINRDGKPDICLEATNGTLDSLYVYINTSQPGIISFAPRQAFSKGVSGTFSMVTGDLDGNNVPELVMTSPGSVSGNVSILSNNATNGSVNFGTPLQLIAGQSPESIALGDINGDGKPDIAVSNSTSNAVSFFSNRSTPGTIAFSGKTNLASGTYPRGLCLGDYDGDGKPDLALLNYTADSISIFRNKIGEALVIPSGTNPVTGGMTNQVTIDPTVQTYNGHPYVQRHYDITPVNDPATATATITLYFAQQEFDNYNAHGAHGLDLPHHATDNLNKANLRVYQYHGFSTTSQPGTYSGNGVEIDPDDTKIVWNATTLQWEVTFDVNGFSGFFIGSAGSSILPVTIISFTGNARDQKALLQWTTTREINVTHFELQRRDNTSDFVTIGKINPAGGSSLEYNYEYTDQLGESPVYHYRLKIVDIDESVTYSKIVTIKPGTVNTLLSLKPNPARDFVVVKHPAKNGLAQIRIVDMFGKTLQTVTVTAHSTQTRILLNGWPKGSYTLLWDGGTEKASQVLIIQ